MRHALRQVLPMLLLIAVGSGGCKKAEKKADEPARPAPAAAVDAAAAPGTTVAPDAQAAVSPDAAVAAAPKALTPEEKARITAYVKALQKGRQLTTAKQYDAAIAALDEALKAQPDDPTALAQRGYARMLKADWAEARKDLIAALGRSPSHLVWASALFNLGKVAEGEGKKEEAASYFEQAKAVRELRKAGAGSTAGACPVRVERPKRAPLVLASWPELVKKLRDEHGQDCNLGEVLKTAGTAPASIQAALLGKSVLAVVSVSCAAVTHHHVVARLADGRPVLHFDFAVRQAGRCTTGAETVESKDVPVPYVFVHHDEVSMDLMCQVGDAQVPCDKAPAGAEGAGSACNLTSQEHLHYFFDPKTFAVSLLLREQSPHPSSTQSCAPNLKVLPDAAGVTLEGRGCAGRKETF